MEVPLLDAEGLRVDTANRLDKEAVGPIPNHGDERADVHAIMWNSEEDDSIYCSNKPFVVLVLRLRQRYQSLLGALEFFRQNQTSR